MAGARWPIEECFGSSKNETGLDNYQVRTWHAWHRHITFAMLAHTFLAVTAHKARKRGDHTPTDQPETDKPAPIHRRLIPLTLAEIRRLLNLDRHNKRRPHPRPALVDLLRRSHQAEARRAHVRRHLRLQTLVI